MNFQDSCFGSVAFVESSRGRKQRLIGHKSGVVKIASVDSLKIDLIFKVKLSDSERLTVACFTPNGLNFAVGTSQGNAFIGNLKRDN
jgi:hypothetical protein